MANRQDRSGTKKASRSGKPGHSPDGVLLFPGGARIAVELELSPKGAGKIENIFMEYAGSQYQEVGISSLVTIWLQESGQPPSPDQGVLMA